MMKFDIVFWKQIVDILEALEIAKIGISIERKI